MIVQVRIGSVTKKYNATEDQLRQIKFLADAGHVDLIINEYNPRPQSLARRSIVSHKSAAFVRKEG